MAAPAAPAPPATLHAAFLSLVPRIELHGRVAFRGLRCPHAREDAVQEMVALCWKWFLRLSERGKDPLAFPGALARFAARAVRSGRRLCGQEPGKDALPPLARRRHGFAVECLPHSTAASHADRLGAVGGQRRQDAFEERLRDNTQTPVADQVCFRLDFPAWRRTHDERTRRLVDGLVAGEPARDLADALGLSPGRVSQLRRALRDDWVRFCGG